MPTKDKTLGNTSVNLAASNVSDIQVFGGDLFKLLSKASSEAEGWMKSTKAMEIPGIGAVVQVTTQQKNLDGTYSISDSTSTVYGVKLEEDKADDGTITARRLVMDESQMYGGSCASAADLLQD